MPKERPSGSSGHKRTGRASGSSGRAKVKKVTAPEIVPASFLEIGSTCTEKLKQAWTQKEDCTDESVSLSHYPFSHGECRGFIQNEEFLEGLLEKLETFEFSEKASDLFQFRQSNDLRVYESSDDHIAKLLEYVQSNVLKWMAAVTQLPIKEGKVDMFLSDYRKNDFLLCHDDELESRRIAFILYLSKDWQFDYGGNLDLFSATKDIHPDKVVKSLVPEFNKFAFFEVGAKSFHQVSEVTEDGVKRYALSGWFYGDPLPRPEIIFPLDAGYLLKDFLVKGEGILGTFCSDNYLQDETLKDINEQVSEESQVLIPGFLVNEAYKDVCTQIVDHDVANPFTHVGPSNVCSYSESLRGPPDVAEANELSQINLNSFRAIFHSTEFLSFLEKVTELPFTANDSIKCTSSLRKFSKGSFSLLKSGGAKQTGETEEDLLRHLRNSDASEREEESEDDPNLVDVMYFISSKWDDSWGGLTIYSDEDGEQLITIPPTENCLAIVVRNSSVNFYVNFVNCNAADEVFFVYHMTFALDGSL